MALAAALCRHAACNSECGLAQVGVHCADSSVSRRSLGQGGAPSGDAIRRMQPSACSCTHGGCSRQDELERSGHSAASTIHHRRGRCVAGSEHRKPVRAVQASHRALIFRQHGHAVPALALAILRLAFHAADGTNRQLVGSSLPTACSDTTGRFAVAPTVTRHAVPGAAPARLASRCPQSLSPPDRTPRAVGGLPRHKLGQTPSSRHVRCHAGLQRSTSTRSQAAHADTAPLDALGAWRRQKTPRYLCFPQAIQAGPRRGSAWIDAVGGPRTRRAAESV